jgi:hypothetical protein
MDTRSDSRLVHYQQNGKDSRFNVIGRRVAGALSAGDVLMMGKEDVGYNVLVELFSGVYL